jgi:hypothetical protein
MHIVWGSALNRIPRFHIKILFVSPTVILQSNDSANKLVLLCWGISDALTIIELNEL